MKTRVLTALMAALLFTLFASVSHAEQGGIDAELEALLKGDEEVPVYEFPKIEPEYYLSIGPWLTWGKGYSSLGRYEYLEDSFAIGAGARVFKFPHRVFLQYDRHNLQDYFLDLRYAYGDKVLFRWVNASLYHNTEPMPLIDMNSATASPSVDVRDAGDSHGIASSHNTAVFRYKFPGYAAHVFFNYHSSLRDGSISQRNLLGSGFFTDMKRTSQASEIDTAFYQYELGGNAHLGHVEAQYAFLRRYFDTTSKHVMHDSYTANVSRNAGVYPHNSVPELEGFGHTIKLHSSYTGRFVASATFTAKEMENKTSGAKSDYLMGMASFTWMPVTSTTLYVTYRHKDMDIDNPSSVSISDSTNPANTYSYNVKPSIASRADYLSVTGRYRPVDNVILRGRYRLDRIERTNAASWGLPDETTKSTFGLSVDGRITKKFSIKAEYDHTDVDNPAYNTEPDQSDRARLAARLASTDGTMLTLAYTVSRDERGSLVYDSITNARDRESLKESSMATVTKAITEKATLSGSYFLLRNHVRQDLVYQDLSGNANIAPGAVQSDKSHGFSIDLGYLHNERLTLNAGLSYTRSRGSLVTHNKDLSEPVSIGSFTNFQTTEAGLNASGDYKISEGYSLQAEYTYKELRDFIDSPYDGIGDATVQTAMVVLTRKW